MVGTPWLASKVEVGKGARRWLTVGLRKAKRLTRVGLDAGSTATLFACRGSVRGRRRSRGWPCLRFVLRVGGRLGDVGGAKPEVVVGPWPAAGASGQLWPAVATSGQLWPAMASSGRPLACCGWQVLAAAGCGWPDAAAGGQEVAGGSRTGRQAARASHCWLCSPARRRTRHEGRSQSETMARRKRRGPLGVVAHRHLEDELWQGTGSPGRCWTAAGGSWTTARLAARRSW